MRLRLIILSTIILTNLSACGSAPQRQAATRQKAEVATQIASDTFPTPPEPRNWIPYP